MRVSDSDHRFEETVRVPPGLSSRSVFHKTGPKVKQKAEGETQSCEWQWQVQVQGQERQGELKRKRFEGRDQIHRQERHRERRLQFKNQRKIETKEGCVEGTEKIKDSVEDILHDPAY